MAPNKFLEAEIESLRLKYPKTVSVTILAFFFIFLQLIPEISEDYTSINVEFRPSNRKSSNKIFLAMQIHIPRKYPERVQYFLYI